MGSQAGAHIAIEDVSHRYRNADGWAVDSVSLTVEPGEAVALLGRSGCGKSTLLHVIAGLIKPAHGRVVIDGRVVTGPSPNWVVMFQQPSLYPWMTVEQNVAVGLRFNGRMKEAATRVPELLELVELSEFRDRNVQDLSGGQQQRVALARALALSPDALLLDEPFSALDAFTRANLQRDVRRITRERGITLVLVTHDVNEAATMADRALIMQPGRIVKSVIVPEAPQSQGDDQQFRLSRAALIEAYEAVAGMSFADIAGQETALGAAEAEPGVFERRVESGRVAAPATE